MTNPSVSAETASRNSTASTAHTMGGELPVVVTDPRTAGDDIRSRAGEGARIALVPTMGALHAGHLSLVKKARKKADFVVVSIFVNPLQFGPREDLATYPRDLDADVAALAGLADVVFAPSPADMYPTGAPIVTIDPGPVGRMFEGEARPRLFSGALTVVAKLFSIVRPNIAVFGEKDAQQVFLIEQMVRDLNLPVSIARGKLLRGEDGLALSSRNAYLSPLERVAATSINAALSAAADNQHLGLGPALSAAQAVLVGNPGLSLEYLVAVDPTTFLPVDEHPHGDVLLIVAAQVGSTRLIDNQKIYFA